MSEGNSLVVKFGKPLALPDRFKMLEVITIDLTITSKAYNTLPEFCQVHQLNPSGLQHLLHYPKYRTVVSENLLLLLRPVQC
jgi:hypothetical protein